jgi:hypothetical protein
MSQNYIKTIYIPECAPIAALLWLSHVPHAKVYTQTYSKRSLDTSETDLKRVDERERDVCGMDRKYLGE